MNFELVGQGAGRLLLALGLILTNGCFVAAEIALVKVRETQLAALRQRRARGAEAAARLRSRLNAAIGATQLGVTIASLTLGWLIEPLVGASVDPALRALHLGVSQTAHRVAFGLAFAAMSFLLIVVGEMAPKAMALRRPEQVALATAQPLLAFQWLMRPLVAAIDRSAQWLLAHVGLDGDGDDPGQSLEEIRLTLLTRPGPASGATDLSRQIVVNALDLRRRIVAEVMRPRREITALSDTQSFEACLATAEGTRFSRFPLCESGNLDRTLGVVHCKDIFALRGRARCGADLIGVAKPLIYVPETARLERLLEFFLERRVHLAIVVDEFGGTTGIVTLENILEELVGQIQDEFDHERPRIVRRSESEWEVDGSLPLFELAELTAEAVESAEAATVSGWMTEKLGGFPKRGDRAPLGPFDVVVEELDGLRVARAALLRRSPAGGTTTD